MIENNDRKFSRRYSDPDQYDLLLANCTNFKDLEFVLKNDKKQSIIHSRRRTSFDYVNYH